MAQSDDRDRLIREFSALLDKHPQPEQQEQQMWVDLDDEGHPAGTTDTFTNYDEIILPDGRILRRYEDGAVRIENPISGVIQEERPDGSLIVSLPSGKALLQKFRGEPIMFYDSIQQQEPGVARVCSAQLPGDTESKFVFHFEDQDGAHLIELESLRYYRLKNKEATPS